jgi:hypothetical protein
MHLPINVKSPNNISKWHMGISSAFKGLILYLYIKLFLQLLHYGISISAHKELFIRLAILYIIFII